MPDRARLFCLLALVIAGPAWAQDGPIDWSGPIEQINRSLQASVDQAPLPRLDPQGRPYTILRPLAVAEPDVTHRARTRVEAPPCPSGWDLKADVEGWVCGRPCPPRTLIETQAACITCPDGFAPARTEAGWICMTCPPDASVRAAAAVDRETCVSGPGRTPGERKGETVRSLMRDALGGPTPGTD